MIFAKKSVAFPGEYGIVFKAAEDGIVQRQKENLKGGRKKRLFTKAHTALAQFKMIQVAHFPF